MNKLKVTYSLGQEVIGNVEVDKIKDTSFINNLIELNDVILQDEKYKIVKAQYSSDGNNLLVELDKTILPWVGVIGGINKR